MESAKGPAPEGTDVTARSARPEVEGQLPLVFAVEHELRAPGIEDLPDLSVGRARRRFLYRLKYAVDIEVHLNPGGGGVTAEMEAAVCSRLQGRVPRIAWLNDHRIAVQFNVASNSGPEADDVHAFSEALHRVLGSAAARPNIIDFYSFAEYLTPQEREHIDGR